MIISHWFLLKMRNGLEESYSEVQNTFCSGKLFSDNHAINEIMWKNKVQPDRPHVTI